MKVLAIDTSSTVASCAIMDDEKLLGEVILNDKTTHSQKLLPMIKQVLESCKLKPEDIDIYGAAIGPGSFTGLRIGVATIKSLAHAVERRVVGVSSLEALALNIPFSRSLIVPIMDARRDRVFTAIYKWERQELKTIMQPNVMELTELITILKEKGESVVFNGDGTLVYRDILIQELKEIASFAPKSSNFARASSVADIVMKKAKNGETQSYFDLIPEYLRESQAQREYDEKTRA